MKRIFALLLALSMVFTLTSCTRREPESLIEEPKPEEQIEEIIEEVIPEKVAVNAGVFWYDFSDAFLSTVRDALNSELDALGINYENYDAEGTQATQNEQIVNAVTNGTNLLIVNIVDTGDIDAAQNITNIARVADIPVIFFNREVDDSVINSYENACFVGTSVVEHRELQGKMIADYILMNYDEVDLNGDGLVSYIFIKGDFGGSVEHPPEVERKALTENIVSCNAELTAAGKPEMIYYDRNNTDRFQPGNWSKTTAFELMEAALSTNPMDGDAPIEIVIASTDDMALGCVEALNNAGWNTGEGNTIPVFGVDYTADAAAAIEEGKMVGSILQSATGMAETIADLVENVMNGEHVFDGAVEVFNVDEDANKIRVPYEIKMKEEN